MKGPAVDLSAIDPDKQLDTSFRLILMYVPTIDAMALRLDVKIDRNQYHAALSGMIAKPSEPGVKISETDELIMPSKGIADGINLKVNKDDLIRALKELVSDLEGS